MKPLLSLLTLLGLHLLGVVLLMTLDIPAIKIFEEKSFVENLSALYYVIAILLLSSFAQKTPSELKKPACFLLVVYAIRRMPEPPIIIGHSMGGLIAQQLAAKGLARALILLSAAAPWGILPSTEDEIAAATGLMSAGPFWTRWLRPSFEVASGNALAKFDEKVKREVFAKFCSESGQALFEIFFWMFDQGRAAAVDTAAVTCPVLMVFGSDDKVISAKTGWQIAHRYGERATIHEAAGHGHMLLLEPGWERIAERCADWAVRRIEGTAKSKAKAKA